LGSKVRDAQILELINIVSEITSILNFDLKHLDLKDEQIRELKLREKDTEANKAEELNTFKSSIQGEIGLVKKGYESQIKKY